MRVSEQRARTAAHHLLVSALEQRPDFAAVPIAQHDERAHQVRSVLGAARLRSVARDALGAVDRAAAVCRLCVHRRLVGRAGAGKQSASPARGSRRRALRAGGAARRWLHLRRRRRRAAPCGGAWPAKTIAAIAPNGIILNNALLSVRIKFDSPLVRRTPALLAISYTRAAAPAPLRSDDTCNQSQG